MNDIPYPADWSASHSYHGITRNNKLRRYDVFLSVARKQRLIGYSDCAESAARIYDAALWKLLPFVPHFAKPNFPKEFESLDQNQVDELAPEANRIFAEVSSNIPNLDESALRQSRLTIASPVATARPGRPTAYDKIRIVTDNLRHPIFKTRIQYTQLRGELWFRKIAELDSAYAQALVALATAETALEHFSERLEHYRDYYHKQKRDGSF